MKGKVAVITGGASGIGQACAVRFAEEGADIVVAAVGRPQMVTGDWIRPGATVIDVGINRIDAPERGAGKTRLVGDVDFASASEMAGWITPVSGGIGPMTIAMLLRNTMTAAARRADIDLSATR